jgi:hypothetical protein
MLCYSTTSAADKCGRERLTFFCAFDCFAHDTWTGSLSRVATVTTEKWLAKRVLWSWCVKRFHSLGYSWVSDAKHDGKIEVWRLCANTAEVDEPRCTSASPQSHASSTEITVGKGFRITAGQISLLSQAEWNILITKSEIIWVHQINIWAIKFDGNELLLHWTRKQCIASLSSNTAIGLTY